MIDIGGFQLSALEYGTVLETKRCTANEFKIYIGRLTPKLDSGKISIKSVNPDKAKIVNKAFKVSGYKTQNFLLLENATSLNIKDKGNVTSMSKSDGISEKETANRMPVKLMHNPKGGPPHPPHEHIIKKPFKFYDMVYEDLNNKKVSKGTKVIVGFIGGNIYDGRVMYIPNIIERGE